MAIKRKKTLAELMQEKSQGITDTSAYTTKPMQSTSNVKSMVNQVYKPQTSNSTWDRVVAKTNEALNDTGLFIKNTALGGKSGVVGALGQTEFLTQQRNSNYRNFREAQTKIKEAKEGQTVEERLQKQNKELENASIVNGLIVKKKSSINDSSIMQDFNKKQEDINKQITENTEKAKTKLGKYYVGNVAPSMGQSLVGTGLDILAPGMGSSYRMLSYGGNYTQDALATGMNEKESAMYGMTMAGVETALDTLMDKAKGKLIGETKKATGFKDWLKITSKELGINSVFEGTGEALTEPVQEAIKEVYGGEADYENILQRMGQSFVAGFASELLMTGASAGYGGALNVVNKLQNNEQVSTSEISDALKEINEKEEIDISKLLVDKLNMTAQDLYINTDVQQRTNEKIENVAEDISRREYKGIKNNQLIENSELDKEEKKILTEIAQKYNLSEQEIQKAIEKTKNGFFYQNQPTTIENKPISEQTQQVISNEGKIAENQTSPTELHLRAMTEKKNGNQENFIKLLDESGEKALEKIEKDLETDNENLKSAVSMIVKSMNSNEDINVREVLRQHYDKTGNMTDEQLAKEFIKDYYSTRYSGEATKGVLPFKVTEIVFNDLQNYDPELKDLNKKANDILEGKTTQKNQEQSKMIKVIPGSEFKYVKSDNPKVDNFRKQASKYWNNSKTTQKYVSLIERIIEDKNVEVILDPNLKSRNGKIVNGTYKNGVIRLNPYSPEFADALIMHELTHAIGTKSMERMVKRFRKNNQFNEATESLLENYDESEINEEALAFSAQEILGNVDIITEIANTDMTLFEKIYKEIKYLWHQFRGYKNKNEFIEDLYYKWSQAYHSNRKLNQTSKNSFTNVEKYNEIEYNKARKKIKRVESSKTWKSLRDNVDSAVKNREIYPGVNEIELYDYGDDIYKKYTIYYKDISDWFVIDIDSAIDYYGGEDGTYKYSKTTTKGNDRTGWNEVDNKWNNEQVKNREKTTNDVRLSERNEGYSDEQWNDNTKVDRYKRDGGLEESSSFNLQKNKDGTLLALHNLNAEKLRGILELGGFPVPSIAITNPKNFDHSNYGEISVIFNKNTVNPVDSRNEVYSRDGYTPRFPKIGYKINNEIRKNLKDSLRQYVTGSMYDNSYLSNVSSLLDEVNLSEKLNSNNGLDGTIEKLSKNESIKYWYLKENNIPFEEQYREQNYSSVVKNDMLQKFLDNYKGDKNTLNELNFEQIQELKTELEQLWIEENFDTEQMKKWLSEHPNYSPDLDYSKLSNIVMGAYKLNKYGSKKTLDTAKTNEVINSIANEEDVKSWLKNKFNGIVEKKGIKNSKGFYTNTGTPRSFEQLYDDYTLDNVVKIMTALDTTGTESFFGVGTNEILGTSAKRFDSIEQIKEYENELLKNLTPEQYAEYLEPINQKLKDIETSILEINPTNSNSFMAIDNLGVAIQEVARKLNGKTKLTTSRVISIMNKQGYEVTSEQAQELLDFFKEARELPTQYFEAKPQRAVGFEEVASMVIPNNLDADLKQQLQNRGIKLVEYDPNIEGDRNRKMLSEEMQEYKFSISTETKKNIESKIGRYSRIIQKMQQEGKNSDEWIPYANEILRLEEKLEAGDYSLSDESSTEKFQKMFGSVNEIKFSDMLKGNVKNGLPQESVAEEKTYTPSKKLQNYVQRQKTNFKRNMSDMLGISRFNKNNKTIFDDAINEIQKEYEATGKISENTKNKVFEDMYNNLTKEDVAFYNENKEIKDTIRNTTLFVSDKTKADITDYADFKKSMFGNIRVSNNKSDTKIDSFYKELSGQRSDLFPDDIYTTSEQLQRIAEVSKSIRKTERNISAYDNETMSKEYKKWAKNEFDNQIAILEKQFNYAKEYETQKKSEFEMKNQPYIKPDLEDIKFIYKNRAELRKEVEKQERVLLLTDKEKAIVDRLLKDEMEVSEILPGYNRDAIIKSYYARQQLNYLDNAVKEYKQHKKQELKDTMDNLTAEAKDWKDKKIGLQYSRETAIRNIKDIMEERQATIINEEIFEPILHNTSEQTRKINQLNEIIDELELDKKLKYEWKDSEGKTIKIDEATLAQLLIEKKIDKEYLDNIGADIKKIEKIANTFSNILEELVNLMDDVYIEYGYAPVERRKNYFPHFIENKPDTLMSKFANALGFRMDTDTLSTDIAGRTETFKPGRAFNKNILRRTTEKTDYNALKALDMYIQGATDIIYHTEDIQKLRAFNESIRDRFKDAEIKKRILEINENIELTETERAEKIKEIKENIKTPLNGLVTWLDEYTNILANKKSSGDRQLEKDLNRKMYTTMQDIEGKIASNLIGGNLSVSLTNFAPLAQAMGTTNVGDILIGMVQTTQNSIKEMNNKGDNFVYESDFLTSRRGADQNQKQTVKQNVSNALGIPMELIDNFVSESIVRAKYRENIKKGMEHAKALRKADEYARNLMADRSKGALPTIFARKNPVSKLMTSFQVEPNNIISNYFKDMPADAETKSQLAWQVTKLSVASWAFNTILKSIRGGSDVIPNPIGIVSQLISLAYSNLNDDEEDDKDVKETLTNIASDILGSIPFGTTLAMIATAGGVEGLEDTGRFMTSSALPNISKLAGLSDEDVSKEYKNQVLWNELTKPLIYLGLPTGGSQLNKTVKGLKAYIEGGSYSYNKKGERQLQFPVEKNVGNAIKSTLLGKYSLPTAQKYIDNDFKSLSGKETELYEKSNIDFEELKGYIDYSKKEKIKKTDKINYIDNMELSEKDKWNIYEYNIVSSEERKDGTSQLSDAEYIFKNKLATKSEYMKIYSEAEKNEVEFPDTKTLKELNKADLSLKAYMEYKTDYKKASDKKKKEYEEWQKNKLPISKDEEEKRKSLNRVEQVALIQNNRFSDEEKEAIYANYIGKEDTTFQNLNKITDINIEAYLDYISEEIKADDDQKSNIKDKTISGSKKKNLKAYLNNPDNGLSYLEKLYIYGRSYKLDSAERQVITNAVKKAGLTSKEQKEFYLTLHDVEELKDGRIRWK